MISNDYEFQKYPIGKRRKKLQTRNKNSNRISNTGCGQSVKGFYYTEDNI